MSFLQRGVNLDTIFSFSSVVSLFYFSSPLFSLCKNSHISFILSFFLSLFLTLIFFSFFPMFLLYFVLLLFYFSSTFSYFILGMCKMRSRGYLPSIPHHTIPYHTINHCETLPSLCAYCTV